MKHYHMFELNGSENRINNYLTCTISLICFWIKIPKNLCYDEAEWSSISTIWCRQIFMGRRVRWWLGPIFWPSYGVIQINTDGPSQNTDATSQLLSPLLRNARRQPYTWGVTHLGMESMQSELRSQIPRR